MKILANENVPIASVVYLRSKGFDIISIGQDNPSISDEQVIQIAVDEERVIVTYDGDYGELIFKHGHRPTSGVIFIREQPKDPLETARIVEELSNSELDFSRTLTVWERTNIRQRRY